MIWRVLLLAQIREQPARLLVTVLAIALGVALGAAVYLVNNAALNEFGLATKRLVGEADVVVRGPREGFPEQLFALLARDTAVRVASPVLELDVALPGRRDTLKVLGLDPFRAATLQPALIGDIGGGVLSLLQPDAIYLSSSAAQQLQLRAGDLLQIIVGSSPKTLRVLGVLAQGTYSQALGLMDIASAQWTFNQIGRLNRIDLRLSDGRGRRGLSPRSRATFARGRRRRRAASRARSCRHRDARLSGQSEYAGAGRTVDRRVPGLLDSIAVGAAQAAVAGAAAGARGDARPIAARAHRRGRRTRRRRFAARRHSRLVRCRRHPALPDRRSRQRPIARGGRIHARRAAADARVLRDGDRGGQHRRLAAGALRGAATAGAFFERRRRRLRAGDAAQRILRRRATGPRRRAVARSVRRRTAAIRLCGDCRAAVRRGVAGSHTHRARP